MHSVQKPDAPQADILNRGPMQQVGNQISSAFQNSPMSSVFGPIFDRAGSAVNQAFAPLTSAIQNRQTQPQTQPQMQPALPSQPMPAPTAYSQPSMPMMGLPNTNMAPQYQNTVRALWGRR